MLQNVKTAVSREKAGRTKKRDISEKGGRLRRQIAAFLTGILTGMSVVLGFPSFMCAAAASLAGDCAPAVFLGTVLSFLLNRGIEAGIIQICSVLVITAIHFIDPFGSHRDDPVYRSLTVVGTLMLFSCVMTAAMPTDFYLASMRMVNSLLAGCTVFIVMTITAAFRRSGVYDLTGMNGIFLGMFGIMAVSVLSSVHIFAFDPGRIMGTFVLLYAVRRYRSFGGAVVGALTACGVMVCDPSLARNTLLLATAGLVCGAFVRFGNFGTVMALLISSLISLVAVGVNGDTYHMFADVAAGSLLYIIIPAERLRRFGKKLSGFSSTLDLIGQTTSSRLAFAGQTLCSIRRRLDMVTDAMDKSAAERTAAGEVRRCICSECAGCSACFAEDSDTVGAFDKLETLAQNYGTVGAVQAAELVPTCSRPQLIADAFGEFSRRILEEKTENIRMRELRGMLTEQLASMEAILADLSFRSSAVRSIDPALSARVREIFSAMGCKGAKVCVYVDDTLCRRVDAFVNGVFSGDLIKLTASVSALLDCDMGLPDVAQEDGVSRISFAELPVFIAETAVFTASAGGEYSGDSCEIFDIGGSEKYLLLSDGMGTGKRARLDSSFTVSLMEKLLTSGLSMTTVHRLVSSMLRVKGWEESFATMDMLRLDLCGGRATLLKAGAVKSRLCRDGAVTALGGQSFPAGLLADCPPDISEVKLFDGDTIILTSDGADDDTAELMAHIAAEHSDTDLDSLVQQLGSIALKRRRRDHCDDLTIMAVRVERDKDAVVNVYKR